MTYRSIFVGSDGLRHGWRFALFALAIWLLGRFVDPIAWQGFARAGIDLNDLSAPAMICGELMSLLEVALVTWIAARLEGRRIDAYGLPARQAFGVRYWKGIIAALAVILFVAAGMILSGGMKVLGPALSATHALIAAVLWFIAMILVGMVEESVFRGYALQSLWRGAGFWPAALITSVIFAGLHVSKPDENAMDIGMIFFLGLALCLSVRRSGSLWWAVGWHTGFDFGQFFLIGTHNGAQEPVAHLFNVTFPGSPWLNGGELGTEASVFMIPAAIATFLYAGWFLPRRNHRGAGTVLQEIDS